MKRVDTIARVRRAFHVQGWSVKRIARELHVSRSTMRKILRLDETDFGYERARQPTPQIADEAFRRIAYLHAVEKAAQGSPPDKRAEIRQAEAKPAFDGLEAWLNTQLQDNRAKAPSRRSPFRPDRAGATAPVHRLRNP